MLSILSISLLVCGSHMTAPYSSTDVTERYAIFLHSWGDGVIGVDYDVTILMCSSLCF